MTDIPFRAQFGNLYEMIDALGCEAGSDYVVRFQVRRWWGWQTVREWQYTWPDRPVGTFSFPEVRGRKFRLLVEKGAQATAPEG